MWTDDQKNAIELNDKDILVAAAAGSGKTAVLVERVVSHLLLSENDKNHWDVDHLMVVTFTNAAAEEMRQRIEKALEEKIESERLAENSDKKLIERLERQIILLSNASISTMHSFCQNLIRQNFAVLDLDPAFRAGHDQEIKIMQQEAMEEVFEKYYENPDSFIHDFAEKYGSDKNGDEALYAIVMKLYHMAYNQPFPNKWLKDIAGRFEVNPNGRIADTFWGKQIFGEIQHQLKIAESAIEEFRYLAEGADSDKYDGVEKLIASDNAILTNVQKAIKEENWDSMVTHLNTKFDRWVNFGKGAAENNALAQAIRNKRIKKPIEDLKKKLSIGNERTLLEDIIAVAPEVRGLCDLVQSFVELYTTKKKEKNIIDFTDMEHLALKILLNDEGKEGELAPSPVALDLRKHYQEIMVDEYQDTNEVQDAIVRLIAGENSGKVFNVGDVKQSIYRFRSADPALFQQKNKLFKNTENNTQQLITLSKNFRSRKSVLDGINFIFAQCMTEDPMDIDYDDKAALYAGLDYELPENGKILDEKIEIHIVNKADSDDTARQEVSSEEGGDVEDLKGMELEFHMLAQRLREIYQSGVMVYDKHYKANNHYRRVSWRDMVILMRSMSGDIPTIMIDALQKYNIPAYSSKGGGYFYTTEIQVMTALLTIIDNARQDIPLAAVLYSPIVRLSAEELAELRQSNKGELYDTLLLANSPEVNLDNSIKERIAVFLEKLSKWRRLSRHTGVPELIWQLYRDTGYYDFVGGLPGGLVRQANLRAFITRAEEYEKTDFRGLFRFLRFIKRLRDMDNDLEVARTLGENEDVVRIMTIHKSKGLEFPVVAVANMSRRFNTRDAGENIIVSKEMGIGIKCTDLANYVRYSTISHMAVKNSILQESKAEELRVLYVALTRAREKLIMTGTVNDYAKSLQGWCDNANTKAPVLPYAALANTNNYLDWVMPAVIRHPQNRKEFDFVGEAGDFSMGLESQWEIKVHGAGSIKGVQEKEETLNEQLEMVKNNQPLPLEKSVHEDIISQRLSWKYDYQGTETIPAKLSVSEIKRRFEVEVEEDGSLKLNEWDKSEMTQEEYSFQQPEFVKEKKIFSGAQYGTLMHSVMQHIDVSGGAKSLTIKGINGQLEKMVEDGIILAEQKPAVFIKRIQEFFKSDIGKRFMKARNVWRELPFSRMLKAKDFYPEVTDEEAYIFSQGVIDVLLEEKNGNYVIVDYKTDKNTEPEDVKKRYKVQLAMYRKAVEEIMGVKVAECYLYMLHDGTVIDVSF